MNFLTQKKQKKRMASKRHASNQPTQNTERFKKLEEELTSEIITANQITADGRGEDQGRGQSSVLERRNKLLFTKGTNYRKSESNLDSYANLKGRTFNVMMDYYNELNVDKDNLSPLNQNDRHREQMMHFTSQQIGLGEIAQQNFGRIKKKISNYDSVGY